jgi:hypothetical protein
MLIFDRRICPESLSVEFGYTLYTFSLQTRVHNKSEVSVFKMVEVFGDNNKWMAHVSSGNAGETLLHLEFPVKCFIFLYVQKHCNTSKTDRVESYFASIQYTL